jgi:hypothetical protein
MASARWGAGDRVLSDAADEELAAERIAEREAELGS